MHMCVRAAVLQLITDKWRHCTRPSKPGNDLLQFLAARYAASKTRLQPSSMRLSLRRTASPQAPLPVTLQPRFVGLSMCMLPDCLDPDERYERENVAVRTCSAGLNFCSLDNALWKKRSQCSNFRPHVRLLHHSSLL